jgi:hypothetical protein
MLDGKQKNLREHEQATARQLSREATPSHPIRDFIVEFFGILLPGFAFTAGLVLTLALPFYTLVVSQQGAGILHIRSTGAEMWEALGAFQLALLIAAAALSYVWGHVFYRLDPKLPDTISYWSLPEDIRKRDPVENCRKPPTAGWWCPVDCRKRWYDHIWESSDVSKLNQKIKDNKIDRYPQMIEFPYGDLKEWFDDEGMKGLTPFVTWSGSDDRRTRRLDIMKIVLEFTFPEQYARLARNEAHVRLVCSIWYATCYLICFSLIGIPIAVLANGLMMVPAHPYLLAYPASLLVPVATLLGLVWLKRKIEESVHSMRIREILYVFAHFRCAAAIEPKIIDVLAVPLLQMVDGVGLKADAAA